MSGDAAWSPRGVSFLDICVATMIMTAMISTSGPPLSHPLLIDSAARRLAIAQEVLLRSRTLRSNQFDQLVESDLQLLLEAYDRDVFGGDLTRLLQAKATDGRCNFRICTRLRTSGGRTERSRQSRPAGTDARARYAIAISPRLLFDNFRPGDHRSIDVCGLPAPDRLTALQLIFEHELVHLHEFLRYAASNCARPRFQRLAGEWFGHRNHRHGMITPRERTITTYPFRPGMKITFQHGGRTVHGMVNRVNARLTVLVEHPEGRAYTNGRRYLKFYVRPKAARAV